MTNQSPRRPEVVSGERIFLTTVHREDLPRYVEWFHSLEYTAYLGAAGLAATKESEESWLDDAVRRSSERVHFAIMLRETGEVIGTISLMGIDHQHNHATLGIGIGAPEHQGQGYGTEAVRLMVEYGFFFLNLHSIKLWHVAFNERGHRAYLKAGFREAGRVRQNFILGGKRYDNVLMDITRDEVDLARMRSMVTLLAED